MRTCIAQSFPVAPKTCGFPESRLAALSAIRVTKRKKVPVAAYYDTLVRDFHLEDTEKRAAVHFSNGSVPEKLFTRKLFPRRWLVGRFRSRFTNWDDARDTERVAGNVAKVSSGSRGEGMKFICASRVYFAVPRRRSFGHGHMIRVRIVLRRFREVKFLQWKRQSPGRSISTSPTSSSR